MATSENKTPRITKAQRFEDIITMLNGEDVKFGTSAQDAIDFCTKEIGLLQKKNASTTKRQNAEAERNAACMADIVDFLSIQPADFGGMSCTEIGKNVPSCVDFNTSKMSSLCHGLVKSGQVVNVKKGDKSLFKLA